MDVKKYLSQAYFLDQKINMKLSQKEELKARTMRITSSLRQDRVSSSKQKSPMENTIVKMVMLEQEINRDIDKLYELKNEMELFVLEIEDPLHRTIIDFRYIKNKQWDEISELLGYHVRWILKLHNRALSEAEKVLEKHIRVSNTVNGILTESETMKTSG